MRSTQEQLRSDHIGTLELLQQCTRENVQLKKQLKILKAGKVETGKSEDVTISTEIHSVDTDRFDLLELVEKNGKQAEEIKLLKSRLNQTELDLMKTKQSQAVAQRTTSQDLTVKAKKKECDMEAAIFELETELRKTKAELEAFSGLETDLRIENDDLSHKLVSLNQRSVELCTVNENLENDVNALQSRLASLLNDLEQIRQEKERAEGSAERRLVDLHKLLTHQTEQNGILKKELSSQAESAYQLQQMNEALAAQRARDLNTMQQLDSSVVQLNAVIAEQGLLILQLQNDNNEEEGGTFVFTAPVEPTRIPPAAAETAQPSSETEDSSFRFQEFMRLKRENKELKMRLADSGASGGHTPSLAVPHTPTEPNSSSDSSTQSTRGKKQTAGGLPARSRSTTSQKIL